MKFSNFNAPVPLMRVKLLGLSLSARQRRMLHEFFFYGRVIVYMCPEHVVIHFKESVQKIFKKKSGHG